MHIILIDVSTKDHVGNGLVNRCPGPPCWYPTITIRPTILSRISQLNWNSSKIYCESRYRSPNMGNFDCWIWLEISSSCYLCDKLRLESAKNSIWLTSVIFVRRLKPFIITINRQIRSSRIEFGKLVFEKIHFVIPKSVETGLLRHGH